MYKKNLLFPKGAGGRTDSVWLLTCNYAGTLGMTASHVAVSGCKRALCVVKVYHSQRPLNKNGYRP